MRGAKKDNGHTAGQTGFHLVIRSPASYLQKEVFLKNRKLEIREIVKNVILISFSILTD